MIGRQVKAARKAEWLKNHPQNEIIFYDEVSSSLNKEQLARFFALVEDKEIRTPTPPHVWHSFGIPAPK